MTIRTGSRYVLRDEEDFIRQIRSTTEVKQANEAKALQRSIAKAKKRSAELDVLIKRLYESYVLEKLPEKRYETLSAEYEQEQAELEETIAQDQARLDAYQTDSTNVEAFIHLAKKYRDVPELTPGMVNEFVDKIIVHAPVKDGVERTKEVNADGHLSHAGKSRKSRQGALRRGSVSLYELLQRDQRVRRRPP